MTERLSRLEKAYRRNPDFPLFARLADLYLRRGKVFKALSLCEKGCERFPDYAPGLMVLSKCYEVQGEFEQARATMEQAVRLDPENPGGLKRLSKINQDLGHPDLALETLHQAVDLDPLDEDLSQQVDQLTSAVRAAAALVVEEEVDVFPEEGPDRAGEALAAAPLRVEEEPSAAAIHSPEAERESDEPLARVQPLPEWEETEDAASAESPLEASVEDEDGGKVDVTFTRDEEEQEISLFEAEPEEEETTTAEEAAQVEEAAAPGAEVSSAQPESETPPETALAKGTEEGKSVSDLAVEEEAPADDSGIGDVEKAGVAPDDEDRDATPVEEPSPPREPPDSDQVNTVSGLRSRDDHELIRLFQEIETQQDQERDFSPSEPDAADADGQDRQIATVTLAEIYSIQGQTRRAIDIYRQILEQNPDDEEIKRKLAELAKRSKHK